MALKNAIFSGQEILSQGRYSHMKAIKFKSNQNKRLKMEDSRAKD